MYEIRSTTPDLNSGLEFDENVHSEWKVLLLEAGGDENLWGQVPAAAADIQLTERDWQYQTEEMRGQACLGLENQRFVFSNIDLKLSSC